MVEASNSNSGTATTVPDYKAFRSVATPTGCSMLNSNLSSKDGTSFITCKNTADGGTLHLYGSEVINQQDDVVEPTLKKIGHKSDCVRAQFLKIQGAYYAVVCHLAVCLIFNANCTRTLFSFEIGQAIQGSSGRQVSGGGDREDPIANRIWFTCSAKCYDEDSQQEFIALATNDGRIFSITVQGGGAQFVTDCAFTMGLATSIVAMACDQRSKVLLVATGTGQTLFLRP